MKRDQEGMAMFRCLRAWIDANDVSDRALYNAVKAMCAYGMNEKLKRMAEGTLNFIFPNAYGPNTWLPFEKLDKLNYRDQCQGLFRTWEDLYSSPDLHVGSWVPDSLTDVFQQTLACEWVEIENEKGSG